MEERAEAPDQRDRVGKEHCGSGNGNCCKRHCASPKYCLELTPLRRSIFDMNGLFERERALNLSVPDPEEPRHDCKDQRLGAEKIARPDDGRCHWYFSRSRS